ncbi:TPA: hypothetical protein R1888_004852 [Klebsiella oxytoca]|nr:hypothetical protein [Klebsiella oxytoca]
MKYSLGNYSNNKRNLETRCVVANAIKLFIVTFCVFLSIFSANIYAGLKAFKWPMVINVLVTPTGIQDTTNVSAKMSVITAGYLTEAQQKEIMCPQDYCNFLALGKSNDGTYYSNSGSNDSTTLTIKGGTTWGDFADNKPEIYFGHGDVGINWLNGADASGNMAAGSNMECWGVFLAISGTIAYTESQIIHFPGSSAGSNCRYLPPVNQYCSFANASLNFDFGSLNKNNASGASLTKETTFTCSNDMSIRFLNSNETGVVTLDNGMVASISIDGTKISDKVISASTGTNKALVKVTLSGASKVGNFKGSDVLIIQYQ